MENNFWTILNWIILGIVTLCAVWIILGVPYGGKMSIGESVNVSNNVCIDVNSLDEFQYAACYSPAMKTIFLTTERGLDNYSVNKIYVSFVDSSSQYYTLSEIPRANKKKSYRIPADKNPKVLTINLNVLKNFEYNVCENKKVFVESCPVGTGGNKLNVSISHINGVGFGDFIMVNNSHSFDSDSIAMSLANRKKIWESKCKSRWKCDSWGACENGKQRRDCRDLSSCIISLNSPKRVKECNNNCIEDWKCEWTSCSNGFTTPICNDINKCNTDYNLPKKLACKDNKICSPDIVCGNWTKCNINYNFLDLHGINDIANVEGSHSRVCVDKNGCIGTKEESEKCSIGVDVSTKIFKKCGKNYLDIYNAMNNKTIAVVTEGMKKNDYLNIYFDNQNNIPCDYCFDGKMDGDESGVDCGGSCKKCATLAEKETSWGNFYFKFKSIISNIF